LLRFCESAPPTLGEGMVLGREAWLRRLLPDVLSLAAGCVLLALLHGVLGTWPWFVGFTRGQASGPLGRKVAACPRAWLADPSLVPLLAFLALVVWVRPAGSGPAGTEPGAGRGGCIAAARMGLAAGLGIPVAMVLLGKYAVYYGWMAFLPVLGCAVRVLDGFRNGPGGTSAGGAHRDRFLPVMGYLALAAAAAVGWPLRMGTMALEWRSRDYAGVEAFVRAQVGPADEVFADWQAYYPAVTGAREAYFEPVLGCLDAAAREHIDVIIAPEQVAGKVRTLLGGSWSLTGVHAPQAAGVDERRPGRARTYALTAWKRRAPGGTATVNGEDVHVPGK
ncbi:MAG: hypothetical protein JXR77_15375, partial [Lentisphaeria bacterium]|nr:hypothetical protein [Lentisphaeria bacterium]